VAERTPLHREHIAAGARLVDFGGWEMPLQYSSIRDEHLAVRKVAGLFDLSHMGRIRIRGTAAEAFLQRLMTNDVAIPAGRAVYTLMCRDDGGVVDDLVVYREAEDVFMLVVNAANREKDLAWIGAHAASERITVGDQTHEIALLALQGPRAQELLPAAGCDLDAIPYFGFSSGELGGARALISRTGYTGEDGFELFVPAEDAAAAWRAILAAGKDAGVRPCGLGARDACRLEAGLRLYGNDMDESTDPYEAGLGWTVKLAKGDFIGSAVLEERKARGAERAMVGLLGKGRTIPRHGMEVALRRDRIGTVTSGTYSFFLERGIGMASVSKGRAPAGTELDLDPDRRPGLAEAVALPIYRGSVRAPKPVRK
jgi:aminomethyltransferase